MLDKERGPIQAAVDPAAPFSARLSNRVLEPMDRILFGLIMALTFTCTLGVVTAGDPAIRTMLLGALGCNLAWHHRRKRVPDGPHQRAGAQHHEAAGRAYGRRCPPNVRIVATKARLKGAKS
jgi:hypothetical protein